MVQATSGDRPRSADRRPATFGLIVIFLAVGAFCATVFMLEPQIVNPSIASCLLLIIGAPLLAIAGFLDGRSRRRQIGAIRDARRSGISIGNARRPRAVVSLPEAEAGLELDRRLDSGRHADASTREL
jgi:hypothetical protein